VKSLRYKTVEYIKEEVLLSVLKEVHQLKKEGFYKNK
jgi:hypothetical protein